MSKGIFYMLTTTEVTLLKDIVRDYLDLEGADQITGQEALEILNSVNPVDTEEGLTIMTTTASMGAKSDD